MTGAGGGRVLQIVGVGGWGWTREKIGWVGGGRWHQLVGLWGEEGSLGREGGVKKITFL